MPNMRAIPGEFQNALVIVVIDKTKIANVVKKINTERRKTKILINVKMWMQLYKR